MLRRKNRRNDEMLVRDDYSDLAECGIQATTLGTFGIFATCSILNVFLKCRLFSMYLVKLHGRFTPGS